MPIVDVSKIQPYKAELSNSSNNCHMNNYIEKTDTAFVGRKKLSSKFLLFKQGN